MPAYPSYKVRILAAVDSNYSVGSQSPIALPTIENSFNEICRDNDVSIPKTWRSRTRTVISELVQDGWLQEKPNKTYVPSPQLRKMVAEEKRRLHVPITNHELKTFIALAKKLKDAPPSQSSPAPAPARRRSGRVSLASQTGAESPAPPSPSSDRIVVRPIRRRTRHSDPGPPAPASTESGARRRSSDPVVVVREDRLRGSQRRRTSGGATRRKTHAARRHTLAANPTRQEIPSGKASEIQFLPLREALSARARRAIRRQGLSQEMNDMDDETRDGRRKNQLELIRLRKELTEYQTRLSDLEEELTRARNEPSSFFPDVEGGDDDGDDGNDAGVDGMDLDVGDSGMDLSAGVDFAAPESPSSSPERDIQTPERVVLPPMERVGSSGGETPVSKRDKRIRDLEGQISKLRQEMEERAEEARRRQEEEDNEVFYDFEEEHETREQLLRDQNLELRGQLDELRSEREGTSFTQGSQMEESALVQRSVRFDETVTQFEGISELGSPYRSSGHDSGIAVSSMVQPDAEDDAEEGREDERLIDLQEENHRLQQALEHATQKLDELEEEAQIAIGSSEQAERAASQLRKENDRLRKLGDGLKTKIEELEEIEGRRLEDVDNQGVQTEWDVVAENEQLVDRVRTLEEEFKELHEIKDGVEREKRALQQTISEHLARIAGLEQAVEVGVKDSEDAQAEIAQLKSEIEGLREESKEKDAIKADLQSDLDGLTERVAEQLEAIEALKMENSGLRDLVVDKETRISDLTDQARAFSGRITEFEKSIAGLQEEINGLMLDAAEKDETIERLEESNSSLQGNVDSLTANIDNLNVRIANLRTDNLNLHGQIEQHKGENTVVTKKLLSQEELNRGLEDLTARLKSDKESLENAIQELEAASTSSESHNRTLQGRIAALEEQVQGLEEKLDEAEGTKKEFRATLAVRESQVEALEAAADTAAQEKASFERDINTLGSTVSDLESRLDAASDSYSGLNGQLLESRAQLHASEESLAAASDEKDRLEALVASLRAEIEQHKRAVRALEQQQISLERKIASLEQTIEELHAEVAALLSERDLMRADIEGYREKIQDLEAALNTSNADNDRLKQSIKALETRVEHLEGYLQTANEDNQDLREEIARLRDQIADMTKQAEMVDEEKSIIHQKISPYVEGELALDMAVDELVTAVVMAQNKASENEKSRHQLEDKIRILASEGDGKEASPEEQLERLTDRFKKVRGFVQELYRERRNLQDSPYDNLGLSGFTEAGSNDRALQVVQTLITQLDGQLLVTKAAAKDLRAKLDEEQAQNEQLNGYLDDVVMAVDMDAEADKADVAALVDRRMLDLNQKIEELEDRLAEYADTTEQKSATIETIQRELQAGADREAKLNSQLTEANTVTENTRNELRKANDHIKALAEASEEDRARQAKLSREIEHLKRKGTQLEEELERQSASYQAQIADLQHQKTVAVAALQNKLAEALDAKRQLQARLETTIAEREDRIEELKQRAADNNATIEDLEEAIRAKEQDHDEAVRKYQGLVADADSRIDSLSRELREMAAKRDIDIATLETRLDETKLDAAQRIRALEAIISERDALIASLESQLAEKAARIGRLEAEIAHINEVNSERVQHLQDTITILETQLASARKAAANQKRERDATIRDLRSRVTELEQRERELEDYLEDAEVRAEELEDQIRRLSSEHQISIEAAQERQEALEAEKQALHSMLSDVRQQAADTKRSLESDIAAVANSLAKRNEQIARLELDLDSALRDRDELQARKVALEKEVESLEAEIDEERSKGIEAVSRMQQEAERFLSRAGDVKNMYLREVKSREGKRKRTDEMEVEVNMPPPLASPVKRSPLARKLVRRMQMGEREGEEVMEDEGFEGSVNMSAISGV